MDLVQSYLNDVKTTLETLPTDEIWDAIAVLHSARLSRQQVFIMGNGGSAATASHFACDLAKGAEVAGYPSFRVIALTDNMAVFSAYANDCGYESVFARQLTNLLRPDDIVIGISGSGKSANVLNAIDLARREGATTIGLTGFDGGQLRGIVDLCLHVENDCVEQVEDVHAVLCHLMATALRRAASEPEYTIAAPMAEKTTPG